MITKAYLSKMNLTALRELGSNVGVKAPTSLKKSVLIEEILLILNNQKEPSFSNYGRPKMISNLAEIEGLKEELLERAKKSPTASELETRLDRALSEIKEVIVQILHKIEK
ncbi:MAG: hypothetical protein IJC07_02370 [Clostridia bacterium]|nr:hypothetical protein [Clostridia bacterium]